MAIKDIKEVNNFLRCKHLREKIEKLSTIKDYEIAKWADIGFAKDAGLNLGDYLEIIRLLICLKLRNLHEDNLEQLLNIKDITEEEFEAFAELSLMGYCNNKNSEVIKAAKEILDILQIKWVEEKESEITIIKIVKEDKNAKK